MVYASIRRITMRNTGFRRSEMTNVVRSRIWTLVAILAFIIFCEMTMASTSFTWQPVTQAEFGSLLASPDVTVVANGRYRAGGATSPEIRVQNGQMDLGQPFDSGDLTWDIWGANNSLSAGMGGARGGFFGLEATGSGGTSGSASSLPTEWYNHVLIDLSSDTAIILTVS